MLPAVEVLPVQWRKDILLDIDTIAEELMPQGIRNLRLLLTNTTIDVRSCSMPLLHQLQAELSVHVLSADPLLP